MPVNLKRYGEIFGRGITATFAPGILKGAVVDYFKEKRVDTKKATEWVQENKSLWDNLDPERQRRFKQLAGKLGSLGFLTAEWAIDALRDEFPAVASLFLGWPKANNWLARQMLKFRTELQGA